MSLSAALIVGNVCQVIQQSTDIYMHGEMSTQTEGNVEVYITYAPVYPQESSASAFCAVCSECQSRMLHSCLVSGFTRYVAPLGFQICTACCCMPSKLVVFEGSTPGAGLLP